MKQSLGGRTVQRVDGYYLYQVGGQIHPLGELRTYALGGVDATTIADARVKLYMAEAALEPLRSLLRAVE